MQIRSFLTLLLEVRRWPDSCLDRFNPGEQPTEPTDQEAVRVPEATWENQRRYKFFFPSRNANHDSSAIPLVF